MEIWWGFFAIPTFLWVKERARPKPVPEGQNLLTVGFHQLRSTARKLRLLPQLLLFMGAFFLYNDGIQTIITQGSVFADTLFHLEPGELIPVFLMIQIVAFLGSLLFIKIEGKREGTPLVNSMALAVLPLFLMVMVGLLMLLRVDVERGKAQVRAQMVQR